MSWHRLLLLLACVSASSANANDELLSLDAAVQRALEIAPQATAREANFEAAQAAAVSAGRLPDPQLILGVDNLPVTGADAYSTTRDFMTMRKVGVAQEFPSATKRTLRHERAQADVAIAGAQLTETRLAIARDVAQVWIRRSTAERALKDIQPLESDLSLQAAAARASVASSRGSTVDALAAEGAIAQLHNRVVRMQSEIRKASAELARWLDRDADRPLSAMPSLDVLPAPPETLLAGVHEHGSLLPFDSRIDAAKIDVDLAKAERRPDWSAELAFGKRGPDFSDMVSLQLRVGLPLFTKYRQDPGISAKHAELRRLEAEREEEVRMHTAEIRETLVDWQQLGEQLRQYEREILPLAHERSAAALASFRSGRGELRAVLDARKEEIDSIVERAQLQNERGRAWAALRYLGPEHLHMEGARP